MSRQTRNSLDSAYSMSTSSTTTTATSTSGSGFGSSGVLASDTPSPQFLASVVTAVRAALAAEHPTPSPPVASSSLVVSASDNALGVAPMSMAIPGSFAFGPGTASSPSFTQPPGRSSVVVPCFVNTFSMPVLSTSVSSTPFSSLAANLFAPDHLANFADASNAVPPAFQQPFVVGPGFSPVPAKLVAQIVAGRFIDFSDLLTVNISHSEPEPQLLFDGRIVLNPTPRRLRRRIEDIVSWMEAFSVFSLVLTSHFPHRSRDLTRYSLLILRTYKQFSGRVWLTYDQAFREHAAAVHLSDWSDMDVQLFNFHAAGASARSRPQGSPSEFTEANSSSTFGPICRSWNRGRCSAPYATCRFVHKCSNCSGTHRAKDCSRPPATATATLPEAKRRSLSPGPVPAAVTTSQ